MHLFSSWLESHPSEPRVVAPFLTQIGDSPERTRWQRWREVLNSDALVLGGGGYFSEPPQDQQRWGLRLLSRYATVSRAFRLRGKPYAVVGVGIGPLSNLLARREVVDIFRGARVASVRDSDSLQYLEEYGLRSSHVEVTADGALALKPDDLAAEASTPAAAMLHPIHGLGSGAGPVIAVHLASPSPLQDSFRLLIWELARALEEEGVYVLAITDQEDATGHLEASQELARAMGNTRSRVVPYTDAATLTSLLGSVDGVITTKLHVGIVAAHLGRTVLSLAKHSKTPRFYSQIGRCHRCIPLSSLQPTQVGGVVKQWLATCDQDPPIPTSVRESAARNKELVHQFLSSLQP